MNDNGITVNPYSLSSFYCEALFNSTLLSTATCFLTKRMDRYYIVTNWHVVSGRNPDTGVCLSKTGAIPNNIHVFFPTKIDGGVEYNSYQVVSLMDTEDKATWIEKEWAIVTLM